ncbi:MAG: hypothetical protein WBE13_11165 [Candidatus Acidiferrum sp.]
MIHNKPFRKLGVSFLAIGAALLLAQLKCDASARHQQKQEQSQPQQQSQQPPPPPSRTEAPSSQPASQPAPPIGELPIKRRKVWTNDDVVSLRSPADNYELETEAKKAADTAAAAKEAAIRAAVKTEKQNPLDIKMPDTVEETEKMVNDTQSDIHEETVVLDKMQQELTDTPLEEQAQKQTEIDRLNTLLGKSQSDLKALQEHLQTLREKSQKANPPVVPPPPSI